MSEFFMARLGFDSWSKSRGAKILPPWKGCRLLPLAILAGGLLVSLPACSLLPFRVEGERPLLGDVGPQRKTVVAKEPPCRLVAVDGTICDVPAAKFESVKVDDRVWCAWRERWSRPSVDSR
ncbi:MAG: hypothetical protein PVJ76_07840 [Gemmatimonadota bacterium]|jgi:hypothetical protein